MMHILAFDFGAFAMSQGFGAIVAAAITLSGGFYIKWRLDERLLKIKADLDREDSDRQIDRNRELERFKDMLRLEALVQDVQFRKLHEKRAESLEALHTLMLKAYECAAEYRVPREDKNPEEINNRCARAVDAFRALDSYWQPKQIFFSKRLSDRVRDLIHRIDNLLVTYNWNTALVTEKESTFTEKWNRAWEELEQKIAPVLEELQGEFRELIGVKEK